MKLIKTGSSISYCLVCYYIYLLILNSVLLLNFRLCSNLLCSNYPFSPSQVQSPSCLFEVLLKQISMSLQLMPMADTTTKFEPSFRTTVCFLIWSTCYFMQLILGSCVNCYQAKYKHFIGSVVISKEFFGLCFPGNHRLLKHGL